MCETLAHFPIAVLGSLLARLWAGRPHAVRPMDGVFYVDSAAWAVRRVVDSYHNAVRTFAANLDFIFFFSFFGEVAV